MKSYYNISIVFLKSVNRNKRGKTLSKLMDFNFEYITFTFKHKHKAYIKQFTDVVFIEFRFIFFAIKY